LRLASAIFFTPFIENIPKPVVKIKVNGHLRSSLNYILCSMII
jgi:hypothetical protein